MNKTYDIIVELYIAAKNAGPLAVARVVECAIRRGYSVTDLEASVLERVAG